MRVGFDARWYNTSGVGTYVAGLFPALVRAGCDVVVYFDPENPVPEIDTSKVKTVPVRSGRYSPFSSFEFQRRAKEDKLDVFHSPFYVAPRLECPVVVTMHDLIPFLFPIYHWPKSSMVKAGYREAARRAAHIIADSEQTSSDIQKVLGVSAERITAIHLAPAGEYFHACCDADELDRLQKKYGLRVPYIVAASALNWRTKNLEGALKVAEAARVRTNVEFCTAVYGPCEGMKALGTNQAKEKLSLIQAGYVSKSDLSALFRHAHAFVMPSFYEGFGLPLVEAMACGCPVITSNRGSLPEVAGDGAQCFAPFDVEGMAAALAKLLCSPDELKRRRAQAIARAADFSWDKAAQATLSVYHHVNR
jgi:glycosyltransferase involved in cell wall biosynthesis